MEYLWTSDFGSGSLRSKLESEGLSILPLTGLYYASVVTGPQSYFEYAAPNWVRTLFYYILQPFAETFLPYAAFLPKKIMVRLTDGKLRIDVEAGENDEGFFSKNITVWNERSIHSSQQLLYFSSDNFCKCPFGKKGAFGYCPMDPRSALLGEYGQVDNYTDSND